MAIKGKMHSVELNPVDPLYVAHPSALTGRWAARLSTPGVKFGSMANGLGDYFAEVSFKAMYPGLQILIFITVATEN